MENKYIIAHDMGTSSNKAILISIYGEIIDSAKQEYPLHHPQPDFAEQDTSDWWNAVCETTRSVLKKTGVKPKDIVGITFSAQNQVLVPLDASGTPLMRAISWLDSRSVDILNEEVWTPPRVMGYNIHKILEFLRINGGSPGQSGKDQIGKILWLRKHKPDIFSQVHKFVDAKDYIIYRLTGKIVTSVDIAVIWWFLDTRKNRNQWHPKLCRFAGITPEKLATVKMSADIVGAITGEAAKRTGLLSGTPVINGSGDLSAAALGSGAISEGELHICLGTSGWVGGHFTKRKIDIPHYTGCIGSTYPEKYYLAMAHQETAGACLEWLKNNVLYHVEQIKKEDKVSDVFKLMDKIVAETESGSSGLMFTPWMFGERCPLDDEYVRSGFFNVNLSHTRNHIIRAVFEGIAFNTRWAMETMENLYNKVTDLNIVGGCAKSDIWCQIIADIFNRNIHRVQDPQQAGARGISLLASMALGYIDSFHDIKKYINIDRTFHPNQENRGLYDHMFREYKNIYKQNKSWYKRMNKK